MIGVGNMASAIARAVHKAGHTLLLYNRTMAKIEDLAQELDGQLVGQDALLEALIKPADLIFIGVKPHQFEDLFKNFELDSEQPKIWVSMAAGLSLDYLKNLTPEGHQWIRMMPNIAVQVGEGFISYDYLDGISEESLALFTDSLVYAGQVQYIEEEYFDAVIGMAGSSPAFIFQLIEAMSDVGVQYGLSRKDAILMASQAVKGAASLVIETGDHPAQLKDKVSSPGGTTIAGVVELERSAFRAAIINGVSATIDKSLDMNK